MGEGEGLFNGKLLGEGVVGPAEGVLVGNKDGIGVGDGDGTRLRAELGTDVAGRALGLLRG